MPISKHILRQYRETIWAILNDEVDDATVNQLVWHWAINYNEATGSWDDGRCTRMAE